jgi:hypothetical protein
MGVCGWCNPILLGLPNRDNAAAPEILEAVATGSGDNLYGHVSAAHVRLLDCIRFSLNGEGRFVWMRVASFFQFHRGSNLFHLLHEDGSTFGQLWFDTMVLLPDRVIIPRMWDLEATRDGDGISALVLDPTVDIGEMRFERIGCAGMRPEAKQWFDEGEI